MENIFLLLKIKIFVRIFLYLILSKKLNLKFYRISRELIEDGKEILEESKNKNIVLLVLGDSMIATTHNDLRMRAIKCGIPNRIIHNANIITSSFVETGLHTYKIGKVVTMTLDTFSSISAVYNTIHANLLLGLHTLILLEYFNVIRVL